jgi:RimJ/RimL family protein N-acetyltransferase
MRLEFERCAIRSWEQGDLASLVRHADNRNVWRNLRDRFPHPYTEDDGRAWLQAALSQDPETHFAIEIGGEAVGGIGIVLGVDVARRSAEIGYWLGEPFWGRGIMSEAVRTFTDWAFAQFDVVRIQADVFAWNPASTRVLEKAGFVLEGRLRNAVTKNGETIDQLVYARLRE